MPDTVCALVPDAEILFLQFRVEESTSQPCKWAATTCVRSNHVSNARRSAAERNGSRSRTMVFTPAGVAFSSASTESTSATRHSVPHQASIASGNSRRLRSGIATSRTKRYISGECTPWPRQWRALAA